MSTAAVIGAGAVGQRIARQLASRHDVDRLVLGSRHTSRLRGLAAQLLDVDVEVVEPGALPEADVVVLSLPSGGHAALADKALRAGRPCGVALGRDLRRGGAARARQASPATRTRSLVVGAGFSPGYSCLLARHGAAQFDVVTEVHIARVGTGGPANQRQLHRARTGTSIDWRDGVVASAARRVRARAGVVPRSARRARLPTGLRCRTLCCWYPAFGDVERVTARVAGTRRDRLTAHAADAAAAPPRRRTWGSTGRAAGLARWPPLH